MKRIVFTGWYRLVKTLIFSNWDAHAYVTLIKSGSHRLFFSTIAMKVGVETVSFYADGYEIAIH